MKLKSCCIRCLKYGNEILLKIHEKQWVKMKWQLSCVLPYSKMLKYKNWKSELLTLEHLSLYKSMKNGFGLWQWWHNPDKYTCFHNGS